MREVASWIFGLLASMIIGAMFGAWLLNSLLAGGIWGALAGALSSRAFVPGPSTLTDLDRFRGGCQLAGDVPEAGDPHLTTRPILYMLGFATGRTSTEPPASRIGQPFEISTACATSLASTTA
jgi:hypothetical protein